MAVQLDLEDSLAIFSKEYSSVKNYSVARLRSSTQFSQVKVHPEDSSAALNIKH